MASRLTRRLRSGSARRRPLPPRASRIGELPGPIFGRAPDGSERQIDVGPDDRLVFAFLTSSCTSCRPFWDGAGMPAGDGPPPLVIVTPDPETEDRAEVARRAPAGVPVLMSTATWHQLGVQGSPFFIVIADGRVRSEGFALTWPELLELIG